MAQETSIKRGNGPDAATAAGRDLLPSTRDALADALRPAAGEPALAGGGPETKGAVPPPLPTAARQPTSLASALAETQMPQPLSLSALRSIDDRLPAPPPLQTAPPLRQEFPDTVPDTNGADPCRKAKRRGAAPSRERIAANDDAPSIGGLIYALEQKPSNRPLAT